MLHGFDRFLPLDKDRIEIILNISVAALYIIRNIIMIRNITILYARYKRMCDPFTWPKYNLQRSDAKSVPFQKRNDPKPRSF